MLKMRFLAGLFVLVGCGVLSAAEPRPTLSLVVMDPLAAPLSCPCVEGYAQRDYKVLAEHLSEKLGRKVTVHFGETLAAAKKKAGGKADILIGKNSVVIFDAKEEGLSIEAVGRLTDKTGSVDQYGMIVVNKDDPAEKVTDLNGYTVIFGPAEADEKHAAALQLLDEAGIVIPKDRRKMDDACSDGACKVIDLGPKSKTAAVISSYAQPLLEGCGTIKKGDLRVVGKTAPVPFITAFVSADLSGEDREAIETALAGVALEPTVISALESLVGFLPVDASSSQSLVSKKK